MAKKERLKKVVIVNRFGPFDKDITGKSLWQLGQYLSGKGCEITYVCVQKSNKSNAPDPPDEKSAKVKYVPILSFGNNAFGRLLSSLLECKLLFWRTLFTPADVLIVMSAPPIMNLFGIWLKQLTRRKVIFWTMDLYPDAFVSSGLVKSSSATYKYLEKITYRNPPHAFITLGEQQQTFIRLKYGINKPSFILPCGIKQVTASAIAPAWIAPEDKPKIKFCYAGNIGEAHDETFILALAQALDPVVHTLYINLYGNKADDVMQKIALLPVVQQIDFLAYEDMHHLDIHVVSLLSKWDHVCVPSKAVSAISSGAALLLNTSDKCDAWHMFHAASYWVPQDISNYAEAIQQLLETLTPNAIAEKKKKALQLAKELQLLQENAYDKISDYIIS